MNEKIFDFREPKLNPCLCQHLVAEFWDKKYMVLYEPKEYVNEIWCKLVKNNGFCAYKEHQVCLDVNLLYVLYKIDNVGRNE